MTVGSQNTIHHSISWKKTLMYVSPVSGLEVEMTDVEHLLIFDRDAAWFWIKVNLMLEMICGYLINMWIYMYAKVTVG